ncbi:MAG: 23S rRNA (pseudouridine(1915)-N(3))-methyltransferase RlmH [Tenericutes bacterium]|nr:23S rRNA (pseudouridine(1915)-N(3))-methyltransferase RlmH [Mycoplasmatota bacterium]
MIKVICVGSLKEKYLKELVSDYKNRINKYHKIEIVELKDNNIIDEGKNILKNIKQNEYVICLSLNEEQCNTLKFDNFF